MIKAVIFDCFGVLINGTFEEIYARAGGDPVKDAEFIDEIIGSINLRLVSSSQMRERVLEKIGITEETWQQAIASTQYPNQELLAYAKSIKSRYKIAILSNANVGTLQRKFTPEQLAIFDAVVVSAEVHIVKPDPAIYHLTAEKLGLQPEECLFIDDNQSFCEAANAIGMHSVCYKNFQQFITDIKLLLDQV